VRLINRLKIRMEVNENMHLTDTTDQKLNSQSIKLENHEFNRQNNLMNDAQFSSSSAPITAQYQLNQMGAAQQLSTSATSKAIIGIFEAILPTIYETNDSFSSSSSFANSTSGSFQNFDQSIPVSLKIFGKFEICHIKERNLTFKKREFNKVNYLS
jgi:hypothetical protein